MKRAPFMIFRLLVVLALAGGSLFYPAISDVQAALQYYARDAFDAAAYNNNDGPVNWGGNWAELNDDANPAAGGVRIAGSELRLDNHAATGTFEGIQRPVTNLPGAVQATLSFDFRTSDTLEEDNTDSFTISASSNGGASWNTLGTIVGDSQGSRVYDITPYLSASTLVRFQIGAGYTGADEYIYFNAVQVTYDIPSVQTLTSVVQTVQTTISLCQKTR